MPTIEKPVRATAPLIQKPNGQVLEIQKKPDIPQPPQPQQPKEMEIVPPKAAPIEVQLSPEAARRQEIRKRAMTYTVDELKARRTKKELASPSVFQFQAELQLYKRFLDSSRHKKHYNRTAATPVLQHRINLILNQFNVNTYQKVFKEILSLGVEDEVFVLSYVNVIFKQAVLNPSLSVLFSVLTANVLLVLKHTRFCEKMKKLFEERVNEAFVVPTAETTQGTIILLHGIVTFLGNLTKDKIIKPQVFDRVAAELTKNGSEECLSLLIDLVTARGAKECGTIIATLREKVKSLDNYDLNAKLANIDPDADNHPRFEQTDPSISKTPELEPELDKDYPKLFKRSDSIPMSLSELADNDEDLTLNSVTQAYLRNADMSEVYDLLDQLKYTPNKQKTATDLLKAIVDEKEENLIGVSNLAIDAVKEKIFSAPQLKAAIKAISHGNPRDEAKGNALARVYALAINEDIASFDDFDWLFGDMKGIWQTVIPRFLSEIDNMRGNLSDDIQLSQFWASLAFLPESSFVDQLKTLSEWDIIGYFPHLEVAYQISNAKGNEEELERIGKTLFTYADTEQISRALVALMIELDDETIKGIVKHIHQYVKENSRAIKAVIRQLGKPAERLNKLIN